MGDVTGSEMTIGRKSRRWRAVSQVFGPLLVLWKGYTERSLVSIRGLEREIDRFLLVKAKH